MHRQIQSTCRLTKMYVCVHAVVLNQVARNDDEIGLPAAFPIIGDNGVERCKSYCAAIFARSIGKQVRVCQVQYP